MVRGMINLSPRRSVTLIVVATAVLILVSSVGIWSFLRYAHEAGNKRTLTVLREYWGAEFPDGSMEVVFADAEVSPDPTSFVKILQPTGAVGLEGSFFDTSAMISEKLTDEEWALIAEVSRALRRTEPPPRGDLKKRSVSRASRDYPGATELLLSVYEPRSNRFYVYERKW
jgi:hypothetical protein